MGEPPLSEARKWSAARVGGGAMEVMNQRLRAEGLNLRENSNDGETRRGRNQTHKLGQLLIVIFFSFFILFLKLQFYP